MILNIHTISALQKGLEITQKAGTIQQNDLIHLITGKPEKFVLYRQLMFSFPYQAIRCLVGVQVYRSVSKAIWTEYERARDARVKYDAIWKEFKSRSVNVGDPSPPFFFINRFILFE